MNIKSKRQKIRNVKKNKAEKEKMIKVYKEMEEIENKKIVTVGQVKEKIYRILVNKEYSTYIKLLYLYFMTKPVEISKDREELSKLLGICKSYVDAGVPYLEKNELVDIIYYGKEKKVMRDMYKVGSKKYEW